jgi:transposase
LLRRTYREGKQVKHETLGNLSHLPPDLIATIRRRLRGEIPPGTAGGFRITRSLPHGHVAAVLGTMRKLGLEQLLASRPSRQRSLATAMIAARIIEPRSKLATAGALNPETAKSTLPEELGIEVGDERELYEAMDWLAHAQTRIERKLAKRHLTDGSLVLYDVSSSFYTGTHCSLAGFGHSRDGKKGFPQIVYGLLCSRDGCPVAVEVFEGNTADPTTLGSQIEKIRTRFGIERVVMVGDRGMITTARIEELFRGVEGLDWITALRSGSIKKLVEQGQIERSLFDEQDLVEIDSPDYPGERLVACRNPLLAEERARKREELLDATEKELEKVAAATRRHKRPLRGKDKIGIRVGKVINRHKVGKHFITEITDESFTYRRNEDKIAREQALDGMYVIRTSVSAETFSGEETVRAYKDLSAVEQAFRALKTIDLNIRPIYHRLEQRVRAHVFLCMLAYYVEWHMRRSLAPLLFADDDPEGAEAQRSSIVAPAQRSSQAKRKEQRKHNAEGLPVQSFAELLSDLATLTRNSIEPEDAPGCRFSQLTQPTAVQRRAFELLEVTL